MKANVKGVNVTPLVSTGQQLDQSVNMMSYLGAHADANLRRGHRILGQDSEALGAARTRLHADSAKNASIPKPALAKDPTGA